MDLIQIETRYFNGFVAEKEFSLCLLLVLRLVIYAASQLSPIHVRWHNFCEPFVALQSINKKTMNFSLEIGEVEKHTIQYNFNQLLGRLIINVNDKPVKKQVRLFDEPIKELHVFAVGQQEKFDVKIEKERKLLFGQKNRVYVNDRLIKYCEGV